MDDIQVVIIFLAVITVTYLVYDCITGDKNE